MVCEYSSGNILRLPTGSVSSLSEANSTATQPHRYRNASRAMGRVALICLPRDGVGQGLVHGPTTVFRLTARGRSAEGPLRIVGRCCRHCWLAFASRSTDCRQGLTDRHHLAGIIGT
jgi:hypothetical protein